MKTTTGTFTEAVAKVKDLINYGGKKPPKAGLTTKEQ